MASAAIRGALHEIDPRLPLGDVRTMEQVKQLTLAGKTLPAWITGAFAGMAALLAALSPRGFRRAAPRASFL